MGYTNFVPDPDKKPSSLDKLDWTLEDAASQGKEVYILAMSRENYKNPNDATEKYAKGSGIYGALCVNGTIDFIVVGDEQAAKTAARTLHEKTGEKIAIMKYEKGTHTYLDLREALDVTRRKGDPWHLYDPSTESIDALVKKN